MMNMQELKQKFNSEFSVNDKEILAYQAPGRVNLIGEHIDYNGGYVLPAALEFGTTLFMRERGDGKLVFKSANFPYTAEIALGEIGAAKTGEWVDYPIGVLVELAKMDCRVSKGYDLYFIGEIPNGAGLSSSASIEVVTAYAFISVEGKDINTVEIAKLSQRAENQYVGVNSGIMDQFAVANGAKDHAILLMCDTLEYKKVPFAIGSCKLVIGNTNKRRGLVDSKYNERRSECDEALHQLQPHVPGLEYLAQLTPEQFAGLEDKLNSDVLRRRAKHVVEENARVLASVEALQTNDLAEFGKLMNKSHDSLRDLYEVTGTELDTMVEEARKIEGTLGSRMTGAGFGGCTVSLVHEDAVASFVHNVGEAYKQRTGLEAEFYVCEVGDGVHQLKEEA
ncbi:galactokinase [Paenibacillus physcomitrellae]|uniref:Galactokinase n=2 Tax=Paenibacillus physcomitrellae TaxID=1619311 RepID=A0ABQ1GD37_9BACL|nr:galactokinase [Paenibacillus physcomitrellae]